MPRIPQGQFRRNPSVRVENEALPRIEAVNAEQVGRLGREFVELGTQLETAQKTAKSLQSANTVDEEAKEFELKIDGIVNNSRDGKVFDAQGVEVGSLSSVIEREINEFDAAAQARLDPIARESYGQNTRQRMFNIVNKAQRIEQNQIVTGMTNSFKTRQNTIVQRFIDGEDVSNDIAAYRSDLNTASATLGTTQVSALDAAMNKAIAYSGPEMLAEAGNTTANQRRARRLLASLPEAERRQMDRALDRKIDQLNKAEASTIDKNIVNLVTKAMPNDDPKTITENAQKFQQAKEAAAKQSVNEYNSQENKNKKLALLYGKQLSMQSVLSNPTGNMIEYSQSIAESEEAVRRELASFGIAEDQIDIVLAESKKQAAINIMDAQQKRAEDPFKFFSNMDGSIEAGLASGVPERRETALAQLQEYYADSGLTEREHRMVSLAYAEEFGKNMKDLRKGQRDLSGEVSQSLTLSLKQQYGDLSGRAVRDMIELGKGTLKGGTDVPPMLAAVVAMESPESIRQSWSEYHSMDTNLKRIEAMEIHGKSSKINTDITREVVEKFDLNQFAYGRSGENIAMYDGIKQAATAKAISLLANKTAKTPREAVDMAKVEMSKEFRIISSNTSSVMLPKSVTLTDSQAKQMLAQTQSMRGLEAAGVQVDYNELVNMTDISPDLKSEIEYITKKFKDTEERNRALADNLSDNIQVVNDPDNPGFVKIMLWDGKSDPSPLPRKRADGTGTLRLSLQELYAPIVAKEAQEQFRKASKQASKQAKRQMKIDRMMTEDGFPSVRESMERFRGN